MDTSSWVFEVELLVSTAKLLWNTFHRKIKTPMKKSQKFSYLGGGVLFHRSKYFFRLRRKTHKWKCFMKNKICACVNLCTVQTHNQNFFGASRRCLGGGFYFTGGFYYAMEGILGFLIDSWGAWGQTPGWSRTLSSKTTHNHNTLMIATPWISDFPLNIHFGPPL